MARAAAQAKRVAAEGVAVRAARPIHDGFAGKAGAQRHPGSDAFGDGDDIRFHIEVLDGPPFAGAAHAALHLVGDQQDLVFIA